MCVCVFHSQAAHPTTQSFYWLNKRDGINQRGIDSSRRASPACGLSASHDKTVSAVCLCVCVCSYYTHVCSQVLQQELQSVPVHMLSSGPGSSLKLQPDVLAAEGEAITVLEGTLIDVMWLRLITPQPQSTHSLNETVNSLCSASVRENL